MRRKSAPTRSTARSIRCSGTPGTPGGARAYAGLLLSTGVGRIGMRRFIAGYYRLLNVLLGLSVAVLIVPVTIQMIARFTALIPAWIWTEEMARFLFIWMVMLGAMIGVRDATHFDVDVWPELRPRANAA